MAGKVLLGISPGTRVVGLAVLHKGELVEWKVKTFKEMWSVGKRKSILATIDRICDYYAVAVVSIKKIDPFRSSPQLDALITAIVKQAEKNRLKVQLYSLSDLDYDIQTGKKKDTLSEQVATRHPMLRQTYLRERNNRAEYYTKMFEAIAMAEQAKDY